MNITSTPTTPVTANSTHDKNAVTGMLACFSFVGTLGNALAIYVFSRMLNSKQHLTSTMFLLTLAVTDFITTAVIIPFTIFMEHNEHHVDNDVVCKFYNLLATTTVPYSAFIMMAIAVDRYICICHPFSQVMTTFRAKVIIFSLGCFALCMGILASLCYSVYDLQTVTYSHTSPVYSLQTIVNSYNTSVENLNRRDLLEISMDLDESYQIISNTSSAIRPMYSVHNFTRVEQVFVKLCNRRNITLDMGFQTGLQWFSSSLFLVVLVVVSILYALIYHRVLQRRKAHPHIFSNYWCFCVRKPGIERSQGTINENGFEDNNEKRSLRSPSIRSPNARADKVFLANVKIAVTLFVVMIVFVAAYLPAWLMALRKIPEDVLVFYTYFTHNVVNPFIYAFMNQKFRKQLEQLRQCPPQRSP